MVRRTVKMAVQDGFNGPGIVNKRVFKVFRKSRYLPGECFTLRTSTGLYVGIPIGINKHRIEKKNNHENGRTAVFKNVPQSSAEFT